MKKKIIISTIIAVLIIAGGVFWWGNNKEEEYPNWGDKYSPKEDYMIYKTSKGTIIENKKMGMEVLMPEEWKHEGEWEWGLSGNIIIVSPDFQRQSGNNPFKKGCLIEIGIGNYENQSESSEFDTIKNYIEMSKIDPDKIKKSGYEFIEISDHEALKTVTGSAIGNYISVKFVIENRIYIFGTPLFSEDKDICSQEFDKFLINIVIK